jgi:hypothetical protein
MSVGFAVLDPSASPRPGQQVTLDHFGDQVRGTVHTFTGTAIEIHPESLSMVAMFRPESHLRALVVVPHGMCEAVLTRVYIRDGMLTAQVVGAPVVLQRRAAERTDLTVGAGLVWLDPVTGTEYRINGRTENLSTIGALVRFEQHPVELPRPDLPGLLALRLADARALPDPARAGEVREAQALARRCAAALRSKPPLTSSDLALDGQAVMALLGVGPGPEVGEALRHLLDRVLEDPRANTRRSLTSLLRAWRAARGPAGS